MCQMRRKEHGRNAGDVGKPHRVRRAKTTYKEQDVAECTLCWRATWAHVTAHAMGAAQTKVSHTQWPTQRLISVFVWPVKR